jgi:Ni/Co efflux regulator RcnB
MTMRNFVLLAAMAALASPGAATARDHLDRGRERHHHHSRYDRHDRHGGHNWHGSRRHRHVSYVAPYRSWRYRPVSVGYRLSPAYYGSRYYITDYGYYGLRSPRPWERWIRYGDDLLLVNIRSGRVLRVIHYNFW